MSAVDFFDSNVLIYLFDQNDPRRRAIAEGLVRQALAEGSAVISHQVVQETLHVTTRKIQPALSADEARRALTMILAPLWRAKAGVATYVRALLLQDRHRFSFYDSLIVAAALEAGCKRLLTEDLQHGQRIEGLRVENPFRA
jgi:predicted nucleic acid-binding protein